MALGCSGGLAGESRRASTRDGSTRMCVAVGWLKKAHHSSASAANLRIRMTTRSRPSGDSRPPCRRGGGRRPFGAPVTDLDIGEHDGIAGPATAQRAAPARGSAPWASKIMARWLHRLETASGNLIFDIAFNKEIRACVLTN